MIQPSRMPPRPRKNLTNCKNCGAPLHGSVCEYCGTFYMENHIYMNVNNINVKRLIESMNRTPMWIPSMEIPRKGGTMEIRTKDGMMVYCLPDNARCKLTGGSPEEMYECPVCNFDTYGDICVPESCEEYEEE